MTTQSDQILDLAAELKACQLKLEVKTKELQECQSALEISRIMVQSSEAELVRYKARQSGVVGYGATQNPNVK